MTNPYERLRGRLVWDTMSGVLTLPSLGYLPCMLFRSGSGWIGGVQNLDQKGLLNFFVGNYFSQRRRVSLSVNTGRRWCGKCFASRGEQIILKGTQQQLHFGISLEFSLVGKCNARFIEKISQLKSDIRSCRYKDTPDPPPGSATGILQIYQNKINR